jgi:hypothetical protein
VTLYSADTDSTGFDGIYRQAAGASPVALVPESSTVDSYGVSASQDGSRFIYIEDDYGTDRTRITVRDISGRLVRVLANIDMNVAGAFAPALSPDGSTAVWDYYSSAGLVVQKAAVASGAPVTVAGSSSFLYPTFLNSTTLLGSASGVSSTLPVAGGTTTAVSGIPNGVFDFAVSPDGTKVAWSNDTSTGSGNDTADIVSGDVTFDGTTATVTGTATRATGQYNSSPAFTADNASLRFIKYDGDVGDGNIWQVPLAGGTAVEEARAGDEYDMDMALLDSAVPAAATTAPAILAGTSATVRWSLPADPNVAGVLVTRKLGSTVQKYRMFVPRTATSYADTGLVLGSTYTYVIETVSRSNVLGAGVTRNLTARKPSITYTDPTSSGNTTAAFKVTLPAGTYTVKYRTNGAATWNTWVTNGTGTSRTFPGVAGNSYAFSVQSFDGYGNSSAVVSGGTAVVPRDQTAATYGGSTAASSASYRFLGSARTLRAAGSYARISVVGNRFQVIGERCTTCGVMYIYDGATKVATVDTRASTHQLRQVLYARGLTSGTHTMTIKAAGTAGRPNVILDAFAARR